MIAGGILISMLVITISIFLTNSFRDAAEHSYRLQHLHQINAYNLYFTKYGNEVLVTGIDAYNILSRVEEVNNGNQTILISEVISDGPLNLTNYKDYFFYTERLFENNIMYSYEFDYEVNKGIGEGLVAKVTLQPGVEKVVP